MNLKGERNWPEEKKARRSQRLQLSVLPWGEMLDDLISGLENRSVCQSFYSTLFFFPFLLLPPWISILLWRNGKAQGQLFYHITTLASILIHCTANELILLIVSYLSYSEADCHLEEREIYEAISPLEGVLAWLLLDREFQWICQRDCQVLFFLSSSPLKVNRLTRFLHFLHSMRRASCKMPSSGYVSVLSPFYVGKGE